MKHDVSETESERELTYRLNTWFLWAIFGALWHEGFRVDDCLVLCNVAHSYACTGYGIFSNDDSDNA